MQRSNPMTERNEDRAATWVVLGLVVLAALGFAGYALYEDNYTMTTATGDTTATATNY